MARRKAGPSATQDAFQGEGFTQDAIRTIENQADKVKEDLAVIEGGKDDLKTHRAKIAELMHANADKLQTDPKTGDLIYKRGEYDVRVNRKETVSVKIADVVQAPK